MELVFATIPTDGVERAGGRASAMAAERHRVSYSGRVQGVGFRATARSLARGFAVSGYVCNLPDGRVELVAEGEPEAITGFLAAVRREMGPNIYSSIDDLEPPGEPGFKSFTIRY